MDRSSKLKINKETQSFNETLDQMELIDIFRTSHPNAEEYTFFSSAHGTFSRIDNILGHKSILKIFKKLKLYQPSFLTQHYETRYQLQAKKAVKNTNTWILNNKFLNNQHVIEEIKKGYQKIPRNR